MSDRRPLVAHVIYRLQTGGLENGLVNLINRLPRERFRHAVVCLTEATAFAARIEREDVRVHELHKREGNDPALAWRLWRLFRAMRPAIVHTRNLAALEAQLPAALAGVPCRIHGEHGWDVHDPDGRSRRYRLVRRLYRPFVHRYVTVSAHLRGYLVGHVGVARERVETICNGVDTARFRPGRRRDLLPEGFAGEDDVVCGWVGRMEAIKDPVGLARAFAAARRGGGAGARLRLVMVGDGSERAAVERALAAGGARGAAWLPGAREDVAELMRAFDVFVLPSRAEGISNTVLEAMATGLPVIATRVGGNPELVEEGITGTLVPPRDPQALAAALARYAGDPVLRAEQGRAARERAELRFSIAHMVRRYESLYGRMLVERLGGAPAGQPGGAV